MTATSIRTSAWRAPEPAGESSPLTGVRVLDFSALGPGPFCTMLLAAWGADVISIDRPGSSDPELNTAHFDVGKRCVQLDLKSAEGREIARRLAAEADVVFEGFRPGAMERLGLGPQDLREVNPGLIYVRLTGYGQDGPYAQRAGHDINYLAISGALAVIGRGEAAPPLAMLGDFAGGGLTTAFGLMLALRTRDRTGVGTVLDASIVDGVSMLMYSTAIRGLDPARVRMLDGTAPFYTTYPCADGRRLSVGALESRFFVQLLGCLGIDRPDFVGGQFDIRLWPEMRELIGARLASKPRDEWAAVLGTADTCTAPVLEADELAGDPHLTARGTYRKEGDTLRVAVAPRLDSGPLPCLPPPPRGQDGEDILAGLGFDAARIEELRSRGVIGARQADGGPR